MVMENGYFRMVISVFQWKCNRTFNFVTYLVNCLLLKQEGVLLTFVMSRVNLIISIKTLDLD